MFLWTKKEKKTECSHKNVDQHKSEKNKNCDFKVYFLAGFRATCFGYFGYHSKGCLSETPLFKILACS